MIRNYLKIAWRSMVKYKGYAAINIAGLAIGVAACLLILQYVSFELSFENFHKNKESIYRIQQDRFDNGKLSTQWAAGAFAAASRFKEAIPEIEDFVKIVQDKPAVAEVNNQPFKIRSVYFASSSFFNIFTYHLLHGDGRTALKEPNTIAISTSTAKVLFGTADILGKTIRLNKNTDFKVTAVYEDAPVNTQIRADILMSYATFLNFSGPDNNLDAAWLADGCLSYVRLRQGTDPKVVEAKFKPVVEKDLAADFKRLNISAKYSLQPLTDIHLYSHYMLEPGPTGSGKTTYLLLGIAFFIAVIAWVNYINLATARAVARAKEVGIRKTIGSQRRQLIFQFLSESALLNSLAIVLAIGLVVIAIPGFNRLSGQHLTFSLFQQQSFWIGLTGLFIAGVFLSGLYPAFVLSGFRPIQVLKGKLTATRQGALLRKGLVVFQFAASLFLLIGTIVVYRQIQYMRKQSLGLDVTQTIIVAPPIVGIDSTYIQRMESFKQSLLQETAIKGVAISTTIPGDAVQWNAGGIRLVGADEASQKQYRVIGVDLDYIRQYGLKVIAGRTFSREFKSDDETVVFNRKGIEQLGFNKPEEALGKRIDFWGKQYTVVGVVDNFHQQSLREAFEPLIFRYLPDIAGALSIKTTAMDAASTIAAIKRNWNQFFADNTFEYYFLDDHFDEQYKADQRFGQVFGLFTSLAMLVACLGLFGLASFTTLQRTKEIGIRKILGASVPGILRLLYREFTLLLLIAFFIAGPLAWMMVNNWLRGYAFRIDIHWLYFVLPFVFVVLVALITVSFQSIKAALANPVRSLRSE